VKKWLFPVVLTLETVAFVIQALVLVIGLRPGGTFWPRLSELLASHPPSLFFIAIGALASLVSTALLVLWYRMLPERISKSFPFPYPSLELPVSGPGRLLTMVDAGALETMFPRSWVFSALLCVANTVYIVLIRRAAASPEAKS